MHPLFWTRFGGLPSVSFHEECGSQILRVFEGKGAPNAPLIHAGKQTEQDILQQCTEHARKDHGMTEIPAEVVDKVRAAIRDEAA